jgi:hypothetical protein
MKKTYIPCLVILLFVLLAPHLGAADLILSWKDNSSNEDGFIIQRSPGIGAPVWAEVARVGKDVQTWTDTGLPNATAFSYRVAAYNAGGTSAYTAAVTGTTVVAPPVAPTDATVVTVTVTVQIQQPGAKGGVIVAAHPDARMPGSYFVAAPPAAPAGP